MSSRNKILDCAERIVIRDGVARLTLDAVATESGLSKGGVLYSFPTKEDLIRGLVVRLTQQFEARFDACEQSEPEKAGRRARAYLKVSFEPEPEHSNRVAAALVAAIFANPALLSYVGESSKRLHTKFLSDGLDAVTATIIRLVADGLWMSEIFGVAPVEPDLKAKVVKTLYSMTQVQNS